MNTLTTPGKRLRYFCKTFFSSVTDFAHSMGFQKPGSLYDYFKDVKKPGGLLLDKFRDLGGNPIWLRYGTGSIFADNDAGETRKIEYHTKFPYENEPGQAAPANGLQVRDPQLPYSHNNEMLVPTNAAEMLYLHLGTVQFRLRSTVSIPSHVLRLYRSLTNDITKELDRLEGQSAKQEKKNSTA